MSEPTPQALLEVAERAAEAAARVQRDFFRSRDLEVEEKQANDFVTRADHESEAAILEVLQGAFPSHEVLAEESGLSASSSNYRWLVDPLDGTSNFLQGLPYVCISIACRRGEETLAAVVLDPLRDECFTASLGGGARWNGRPMRVSRRHGIAGSFLATGYPFRAKVTLDIYLGVFRDLLLQARGVRRCGAAALYLAYTAAGVYDGFFEFRLSPWDIAAGELLVREAGGRVTDLDGKAGLPASGNVLAGGADVHRQLRAVIARHVSEVKLGRHASGG